MHPQLKRQRTSTQNKLNPGLVTSYDLRPGKGVGPIFWKVRDRRRDRREDMTKKRKTEKKKRYAKTNNMNKSHAHIHSAKINK